MSVFYKKKPGRVEVVTVLACIARKKSEKYLRFLGKLSFVNPKIDDDSSDEIKEDIHVLQVIND